MDQIEQAVGVEELLTLLASEGVLLQSAHSGGVYTRENLTLYPLYTMENGEAGLYNGTNQSATFLSFAPVPTDEVERFSVNVSSCYNRTRQIETAMTATRMQPQFASMPDGPQEEVSGLPTPRCLPYIP